jgi:hypothetical protein
MINITRRSIILINTVIFFSCTVIAQNVVTTAVPFLLINQSPEANGQGCTSVSRPTVDPFAINFNPAHLGYSSTQTNVIFSFFPTKTDWLPGLGLNDLTFDAQVISGGINLEEYTSLPLSLGIAYSRVNLNYGTFNRTSSSGPDIIGTFNAEEHNDAFSVGLGLDIGVRFAMGITFRNINSHLAAPGQGEEQGNGSASGWTHDYGLLVNIPIVDLVAKNSELMLGIAPVCNLSFGTALTNVGDKLIYIDAAQADPFPRNISLGTSLEFGFQYARTNHTLLSFTWSRQSDNLLVGKDSLRSFYRGGYGDIDFFKNIVQGKRSETIELSQGWQIGIAEIIYIRGGSFVGTGNRSYSTAGLGFQISGFFKLLKDLEVLESSEVIFITEHFDIRYDQSQYNTTEIGHPLDNTNFSSLILIIKF